jgi:hypothetical protein
MSNDDEIECVTEIERVANGKPSYFDMDEAFCARTQRFRRLIREFFWLCQIGMSIDPIDSILLGSKFPDVVHGLIRPHYLHAPNATLFHWR